eukprot:m.34498 g.34498  ORF g.34498 m.34498 type:complete len:337 (+) comp43566_c0_seq1:79-1089(+)
MEDKKAELYTYDAPWTIYALAWCQRKDKPFRLSIGSFIEEYTNKIQIVELDADAGKLVRRHTVDHPYPTTKILWMPQAEGPQPDLFATTGDYLRIWKVADDGKTVGMECVLNDNEYSQFCAPLTSFDWNETCPNLIGTSSIDTTCSIWDITTGQEAARTKGVVKTQLIAHDQEVYDISFAKGSGNTFATVGADGSLRLFDLRNLDHSTVIFEDPSATPLLRLSWNKFEEAGYFIAAVRMDDPSVILLDIRHPGVPYCTLTSHEACVNGISWAPHSAAHISTCADDKKALIWDVRGSKAEAILAYEAGGPINQIQWSSAHSDWIGICFDRRLEILRV